MQKQFLLKRYRQSKPVPRSTAKRRRIIFGSLGVEYRQEKSGRNATDLIFITTYYIDCILIIVNMLELRYKYVVVEQFFLYILEIF